MSLTRLAHQLIAQGLADSPRQLAVDGTCGNGWDSLFLAEQGFEKIIAFDVQAQAITATQQRLADYDQQLTLIEDGHQHLARYIDTPIDCAIFNLGYLPGSDKAVTTHSENSVKAINSAIELCRAGGIVSVLCYRGHSGGDAEYQAITQSLQKNDRICFEQHHSAKPSETTPVLYLITKKMNK